MSCTEQLQHRRMLGWQMCASAPEMGQHLGKRGDLPCLRKVSEEEENPSI